MPSSSLTRLPACFVPAGQQCSHSSTFQMDFSEELPLIGPNAAE